MYKILLADDFAVFRKQIKRMKLWETETEFEICGEASDGDEALKMLRADSFDVLLTDIKMPKMTGIELLQAVKDEGLCGCVVLLSEYTDFEYARQGLIMGAFDYIVKPMDEEKLASMLARCRGFLQTRTDTEYPEFEERAVIGALTGAGELDAKLKLFTDAVYKISSGNAMKAGEIFLRAAKSIYAAEEEQFPWIGYVLGDITIFEESIVRYEEFPMMSASFEKYMRGIYLAAAEVRARKERACKASVRVRYGAFLGKADARRRGEGVLFKQDVFKPCFQGGNGNVVCRLCVDGEMRAGKEDDKGNRPENF